MGHLLIDQNSVERGIRPTKLGAKNWLYIGHPDAGRRSAVIYSITGTCKLLKVNPVDYLMWVLPRLATATSAHVDGLLPHDYAAVVASSACLPDLPPTGYPVAAETLTSQNPRVTRVVSRPERLDDEREVGNSWIERSRAWVL
jgi:IS66 C-terminal element/Transposase IS66 family